MPEPSSHDPRLADTLAIKSAALAAGFDLIGVADAVTPPGYARLQDWLRAGFAGEMAYLPRRAAAYEHPRHVSSAVRSVVMVALNYRTEEPASGGESAGRVARYAWGTADYHDLIRSRLKQLADAVHQRATDCTTRAVVDTAPLLERDFARLAGLGWFGKNTVLIHKRAGSWLLLGALLTSLDLIPDAPHATSHCGTCTRCLDACPTDAFAAPYVLDARRCISYLTIELKGAIPRDLRPGMHDWVFGCDVCQDVCPWNRKSPRGEIPEFHPLPDLNPLDPLTVLQMTREQFRARYRNTPLERPGFDGIRRNAAIVVGNLRERRGVSALVRLLDDESTVVRGAAAWALGCLGGEPARQGLTARQAVETDSDVIEELQQALQQCSDQ